MKKAFKYFLYVCFSTTGRINRSWWWFYVVLSLVVKVVLYILVFSVTIIPENFTLIYLLFIIGLGVIPIYTDILATAKRFHDTNRSARNLYWSFFPFFGALYILTVCGFFKGTGGKNKYGEPSFLIDWNSFESNTNKEDP